MVMSCCFRVMFSAITALAPPGLHSLVRIKKMCSSSSSFSVMEWFYVLATKTQVPPAYWFFDKIKNPHTTGSGNGKSHGLRIQLRVFWSLHWRFNGISRGRFTFTDGQGSAQECRYDTLDRANWTLMMHKLLAQDRFAASIAVFLGPYSVFLEFT